MTGDTIYVRRIKSRKHDYFQFVQSYRNEDGKPRQEVLVHLGEHPTPEDALAAWPSQVAQHRRAGRNEQAEKLDHLRELVKGKAWRVELTVILTVIDRQEAGSDSITR